MAELKFELHSPITEEEWDLITDVDLDHTPSVMFHTKHGKDVEYIKVKHGKWWHYEGTLTCSVCHTEIYDDIMELLGDDVPRYCPNCGADMREVAE